MDSTKHYNICNQTNNNNNTDNNNNDGHDDGNEDINATSTKSTTPSANIKKIFFGSGSIKAHIYIGIIEVLEKHKLYDELTHYYGCSAGTFAALSLVLGIKREELTKLFNQLNLKNMLGIDGKAVLSFFKNFGFDTGAGIENEFKKLFKVANINPDITFSQLHKLTGKYLGILGANITKECGEVFDHINNPDMSILLAVRISCSIPIVFQPVKYNECLYTDGGIIEKQMIYFIFKDCKDSVLGFHFMSSVQLDESFLNYVFKLISIFQWDICSNIFSDFPYFINLETKSLQFYDEMTEAKKYELINYGIEVMTSICQKYNL